MAKQTQAMEVEQERKKTERDLELELGRDYKIDLRSNDSFIIMTGWLRSLLFNFIELLSHKNQIIN